jgi:NAD(P)-dependent dehydrogenase (short-subunit alcohol dehydrogenase family)
MANDSSWDFERLPSQSGKTFVVTGGNGGIGYFVSEQLAAAGGHVIMASRSVQKADAAAASIRSRVPGAEVGFIKLDLSSLASVRDAAEQIRALDHVDVLINNAGATTGSKQRLTTEDGLEFVVGSNAFGPFALTALAFPALSNGARIVNLGSMATRIVSPDIRNLQSESGKFNFFRAYAYSKHAMHAFTFELQRRLSAVGNTTEALLAHPGYAVDGLASPRPGITDTRPPVKNVLDKLIGFGAQGKDHGARPVVRAATDPDARRGEFYGPRWSVFGPPVVIEPVASSASPEFGAELWRQAEAATGISFAI